MNYEKIITSFMIVVVCFLTISMSVIAYAIVKPVILDDNFKKIVVQSINQQAKLLQQHNIAIDNNTKALTPAQQSTSKPAPTPAQ